MSEMEEWLQEADLSLQRQSAQSNGSAVTRLQTDTFQGRAGQDRASWISKMGLQIFSSYRREDFANPDIFLVQLGMVLERYPDCVISEVTSPLTGIQRKCKFPPSINEIVEFCDAAMEREARIKRYRDMGTATSRPRFVKAHRANVFVPPNAPQHKAMIKKTANGDPDDYCYDQSRPGIWVPRGWLDTAVAEKQSFKRFANEELEKIYKRTEDRSCTPAST